MDFLLKSPHSSCLIFNLSYFFQKTPEQEIWVIQRYNRYIREHMAKVAKLIGLEQTPSPTWARHSFATNLNNSGVVPYNKYISNSMGHSGGSDITSNYIGAYPLAKMLGLMRSLKKLPQL